LQEQDRILRGFPEVATVFGSIGRSDSATDNAPLDMYDTTVMLKPRGEWRPGMTYEKLISEMDAKLQFPGLTNTWTMPIENRLDMELTGIKTPVGIKIQGPSLDGIEELGERVQQILGAMPEMRSVFAERVAQGFYVNVEVNRAEAARYGLTVGDVQRTITSGIGGENIAENIEGRERYPISIRYAPDFRDDIQKLARVVIATPSNAQVPLGELAKISFSKGPAMIRDEDAALTGYVYLDLNTRDYGGFVARADRLLREKLQMPTGYSLKWSGEYEFELRAKERLKIILPVVFLAIFMLLYMVFRSVIEALILIFPTLYAMTGGLLLQWYLGYNFSVAVWVGYIALFGIAVETGVVMVVYLHEALDRKLAAGSALQRVDIEQAATEGAVQRLRPKLMTVAAVLASLVPILWETGVGSDVMKPIAAPIVGGMITSTGRRDYVSFMKSGLKRSFVALLILVLASAWQVAPSFATQPCGMDNGTALAAGGSCIAHCKSVAGDCTKATSCCGISTNLAMPSVPSVTPIDLARIAHWGDVQSLVGRRLQPNLHPPTTHI
jgi:copper/silver efflux system protein